MNIAIGTIFAVLVRAALVVAVGIVYWQMFWEGRSHRPLTIGHVDSLAGALASVLDLLNARAFRSNPILGMLALLSWLLPFAALLPPATLSVQSASVNEFMHGHVPLPDLANDAMATYTWMAYGGGGWDYTEYFYERPSPQISRLAVSTASRGSIVDSLAVYANSTYIINFIAPAVQCREQPPDLLQPFVAASSCDHLSGKTFRPKTPCCSAVSASASDFSPTLCSDLWSYIAWAPNSSSRVPFGPGSVQNNSLPLELRTLGSVARQTVADNLDYSVSPFYGGFQDEPVTIHIATTTEGVGRNSDSWKVLTCSLFNASYMVNMTSDSNRRNIASLLNVTLLNEVPDGTSGGKLKGDVKIFMINTIMFNHMALMESVGKIFMEITSEQNGAASGTEGFPYPDDTRMSVQPVQLMQTLVPFTTQLLPLVSKTLYGDVPDERQWITIAENRTTGLRDRYAAVPAFAKTASSFNRSLASTVEQLFHNISMSFLSEPAFVKESDEPVMITVQRTQNVYRYGQINLLLSYGLALGLSLLYADVEAEVHQWSEAVIERIALVGSQRPSLADVPCTQAPARYPEAS
jgi:hypothetical protein